MTTHQEIQDFRNQGPWRTLVALAADMVADAEQRAGGAPMNPLIGGGTRIMLAIEHRISDDIDLFVHDAQWIGFLTPRLNDKFEDRLSGYEEDATSIKLKHPDGEIDFIVSGSLLNRRPEHDPTSLFALEPVEEVIAKKLFYRGWALTARDLFDWKAVSEHPRYRHIPDVIAPVLTADRRALLAASIEKLSLLPEASKQWKAIRAAAPIPLSDAIAWAKIEIQTMAGLQTDRVQLHSAENGRKRAEDGQESGLDCGR